MYKILLENCDPIEDQDVILEGYVFKTSFLGHDTGPWYGRSAAEAIGALVLDHLGPMFRIEVVNKTRIEITIK